jgi:hypothetical protein
VPQRRMDRKKTRKSELVNILKSLRGIAKMSL